MSAGAFTVANYETDFGEIGAVRVQPETLAATLAGTANAAPSGTRTRQGRVKVSGSKRAYGIHARYVTFIWTGTVPSGYAAGGGKIVVPDPTLFNTIVLDGTGTYLGAAIRIVGKSPEVVR